MRTSLTMSSSCRYICSTHEHHQDSATVDVDEPPCWDHRCSARFATQGHDGKKALFQISVPLSQDRQDMLLPNDEASPRLNCWLTDASDCQSDLQYCLDCSSSTSCLCRYAFIGSSGGSRRGTCRPRSSIAGVGGVSGMLDKREAGLDSSESDSLSQGESEGELPSLRFSQFSTVLPGGRPYAPSQCCPSSGSSARMSFHVNFAFSG